MRADRLRDQYQVRISITHFPLHPETPPEGLSLEQLFAGRNIDVAAAQARLKRILEDEGQPYGERSMTYNSRLAQELGKWAETQPAGDQIHQALFHAYFVRGENLADEEVLLNAAQEAGLSRTDAKTVLVDRTFQQVVEEDWQRCRSLGVSSVPTYRFGRQFVVGAHPYEVLERLIAN